MSIAFVRAKIIGRSSGQSAVACAAYRSGERLHDERYGKTHDYQRKEGIMATGLVVAEDAPTWAHDRASLWNAVEATEKRKDAQVARELIVAIPCELLPGEQQQLTEDIARHLGSMGMAVDWALHRPSREGDSRNVHAHLMLTTRELTAGGFGSKAKGSLAREWNSDTWLDNTKRQIESICNVKLLELGYEPLSFDEQKGKGGIHQGPALTGLMRRAEREVKAVATEATRELARIDREIEQINREINELWAAREAEKLAAMEAVQEAEQKAARETVRQVEQPAVPRRTPLEQLAYVTSVARQGGARELAAAYSYLEEVRRMAGGRVDEYPEIRDAARSLKHAAERQGLVYDKKAGQIRPMTRREREDREDRGR